MNLFNPTILRNRFETFDFPSGPTAQRIHTIISGWQTALKDRDLSRTKESAVQGLFLQKFFSEILGYNSLTESTDGEWHLIQHPTSEVDAQEPDGALGFFTRDQRTIKAVIELKDANTSLDKRQSGREKGYTPIEQGYLYATKFDRCNWIIVSNFREIRLYNKHRTQTYFERFNILDLHKAGEFRRFFYLLCKPNLIARSRPSVIDTLADDTSAVSEDISKAFYGEYRAARLALFLHLIEFNPTVDQKTLLESAQNIIDRLIFVLFCENTGNLLPRNLVKDTYELGIRSRERSDERVWRAFKNLFMDIDVGRSDIDPAINRYNSGLFANDDALNGLSIKDTIWKPLVALHKYDFESELDVNILGHIFEQSISDLETLRTKIPIFRENQAPLTTDGGEPLIREREELHIVEKKGRRKKEGIFYTRDSVTTYLTAATIGRYLDDHPDRLETITILDPACGSGAFLNQAHTHLMNEHKARQEQRLVSQTNKRQLDFSDINLAAINRSILLNNIFGVDLNRESVEITKLSLWLKTARASEPLQNLDRNIKCGNSLVTDHRLDIRSFDWVSEFPVIMDDGGFDIIVGNPPYISSLELTRSAGKEVKQYWKNTYEAAVGAYDIYVLFIEQAIRLLKDGGYLEFITPNKYLSAPYGEGIRNFIKAHCHIVEVFDLSAVPIFEEPSVYPILTILKKATSPSYQLTAKRSHSVTLMDQQTMVFSNEILDILPNSMFSLIIARHPGITEKIVRASTPLSDIADVNATSTAAESDAFSKYITDNVSRGQKIVNTGTIDRFIALWGLAEMQDKGRQLREPYLLTDRAALTAHRERIYLSPKIVVAKVAKRLEAFLDPDGEYASINTNCIYNPRGTTLEYLLGVVNSTLMAFIYDECFGALRMSGGYLQFQAPQLRTLPIVLGTPEQQQAVAEWVSELAAGYKKLYTARKAAAETLMSRFKVSRLSERLGSIDKLGWNEFIGELRKLKIDLLLADTDELSKWFRDRQTVLQSMQREATEYEDKIDRTVYEIYQLTQEETKTVRLSVVGASSVDLR